MHSASSLTEKAIVRNSGTDNQPQQYYLRVSSYTKTHQYYPSFLLSIRVSTQ
jgi:hypothetical protein